MTQRRPRKQLRESHDTVKARPAERADALEKANEDLKAAQAELQRRWQYLAEAQKLSLSGTFGWKVTRGELVWSDETYRILGFTRETHPTLDLVFNRIHPDDLDHMEQLRNRMAQNGMDLDVEHRVLLPDGVVKYLHVVAHAGRDNSGDLECTGDHEKGEGCFVAGIEDCAKENRVFREWARSWAKRVIAENAIRELNPRPKHSSSSSVPTVFSHYRQSSDPIGHFDVDSVLGLADFERFVFLL
ncbi:MAG TPA: PAS domain-containing protein [Terriglobales bacterium]|nr:PAS domain-containing protein [Terriglobales bacterium]